MPIGNAFAILKSIKVKVPMVEIFANFSGAGLAFDSKNNIYFSTNENVIKKIDENKIITEYAKIEINAPDIIAKIAKPRISYISFDSDDNLYFGDSWNVIGGSDTIKESAYHFIIRKISPLGIITNVVTSGPSKGILVKNRDLYYTTNMWNGTKFTGDVVKYNLDTNTISIVKNMSTMSRPNGLAINSGGIIYSSDFDDHYIRTNIAFYAGRNKISGYFNGTNLTLDTYFNNPSGLCFDKYDTLYIADCSNHSIRMIKNGIISTLIGNKQGNTVGTLKDTKLSFPNDVKIGKDGCLYISDSGNGCIKKVTF